MTDLPVDDDREPSARDRRIILSFLVVRLSWIAGTILFLSSTEASFLRRPGWWVMTFAATALLIFVYRQALRQIDRRCTRRHPWVARILAIGLIGGGLAQLWFYHWRGCVGFVLVIGIVSTAATMIFKQMAMRRFVAELERMTAERESDAIID